MASENNFEQEWKTAFEQSSLPPPDDLWSRIEKELDKKEEKKAFFFFLKNPRLLASGIAAMLILALGSLFLVTKYEKQ